MHCLTVISFCTAWAAAYPKSTPDPAQLPQAWVDALNTAVSAGKIPTFGPSKSTGGNPSYPGADPNGDEICSTTYKCRKNPENIYDAPTGLLGVSFDDGPLPVRFVLSRQRDAYKLYHSYI